ncbi:MAG: tRNA pseudouridine(13) synthase TruD [Thermoproteota archaeon]|nr:tRNA pseudouridine(13) synthase TruD [Candidatus Brockarchaeota archaeon]MBO3768092.1 tRNA pseudouridine(13) synthase TruD [Candidatus Brockarchaeota archaeon]MBO3800824.1 tRNA pseudouridine(13) synthase TruD [Candidatus Brockarchaeota archaeon]
MIDTIELEPLKFYEKLRETSLDHVIGLLGYSYKNREPITARLRKSPEDFYVKEVISDEFTQRYSSNNGNYFLYMLEKKELTTFESIIRLSKILKIHIRDINYLGLKDKNAVTEQYITIKANKKELPERFETDRIKFRLVGKYTKALSKDYLEGNFFRIILRDVSDSNALNKIERFKELISRHGFANFYGYQRFGTTRPVNHKVGLHLLREEYEYAVKTLIGIPGIEESTKVEAKIKYLENGNIEVMSNINLGEYEKRIVKYLCNNKQDYKGAIMKLHPSLIRLFIEAFSCYVFNLVVSEMIRESGIEGIVGLNEEEFFIVPLSKHFAQVEAVAKINEKLKKTKNLKNEIKERRAALAIATPGYLTEQLITKETKKIIDLFKVDTSMFFIKEKPEASYPGQYRTIISYVKEFYFNELSSNVISLTFFLPRGSFATVLLRELVNQETT